jgi:ribosomal protein S18 acetylase RimI-like enzyme
MQIIPFNTNHIPAAAEIFSQQFKNQRQAVPSLPDRFEYGAEVSKLLEGMLQKHSGVAAIEDGELVGYLLWFYINNFRNARRKAAYCPVWAHAARPDSQSAIDRALYRAASTQWAEAGCEAHAITLLACDDAAIQTWFWSGFGLIVVDAIRPMNALGVNPLPGVTVRQAQLDDIEILADLEAEHLHHYLAAPVFMNPEPPSPPDEFAELLKSPGGSAWLAFVDNLPAGYLRLEESGSGATEIVSANTTVSITGAYVLPAHRGRKIASAMLDAALQSYAAKGYTTCSVDFESLNPEASVFWTRHFQPVCYSLLRVPER